MENVNFRKKLETKEIRSKLKTSERTRSNSWKHKDNEILSTTIPNHSQTRQNVQNNMNDIKKDTISQSHTVGSKAAGYKFKFPRSNYPKVDSRFTDPVITNREKLISMEQEYYEEFPSKDIPEKSSKNYKFNWQRNSNISDYTENLMDDISHKNPRFSRYNSKNEKFTNSRKPNDTKNWNETNASRIRSRTCSPPINRRKRSRSFPKTFYEDLNQHENQQNTENSEYMNNDEPRFSQNSNSNESVNESKFVDRGVDKDSLSDLQNVCTSTERLFSSRTTIVDPLSDTGNTKVSFWEFIPLDDIDDQKCEKITEQESKRTGFLHQQVGLSNENYSSTKRLPNNFIRGRTEVQKDTRKIPEENFPNFKLYEKEFPKRLNMEKTALLNSFQNERYNDRPNITETKFMNSNLEKQRIMYSNIPIKMKIVDTSKTQERCNYESKSQTKISSRFNFEWANKTNRYLKRPVSAPKPEIIEDKKKRMMNMQNDAYKQKLKINIMERTAACLKRKLDKTKIKEDLAILNQQIIQKKIKSQQSASKLPVRIGKRLRSKNPIARNRINETMYGTKQENKEIEIKEFNDTCQLNNIRSRTKPKLKPSVIIDETMNINETSKNLLIEKMQSIVNDCRIGIKANEDLKNVKSTMIKDHGNDQR